MSDVTSSIVTVSGNPIATIYSGVSDASHRAFFRNVWAMQAFPSSGGKLAIATGDSYHDAGAGLGVTNQGVPLVVYDPSDGSWDYSFFTSDEAICSFRIIGSTLVFPGDDDADNGGSSAQYYTTTDLSTITLRSVTTPTYAHLFDVIEHDGYTFAVGATSAGVVSYKLGAVTSANSWSSTTLTGNTATRVSTLFVLGGMLYAAGYWQYATPVAPLFLGYLNQTLYKYTNGSSGATWALVSAQGNMAGIFPSPDATVNATRMRKTVNFLTSLVYIGEDYWRAESAPSVPGASIGLYKVAEASSTTGINLSSVAKVNVASVTGTGARAQDILVDSGTLYVLCSIDNGDGSWRISVISTTDLSSWSEVFYFTSAGMARSFTYMDGIWYFGIAEVTEAENESTTGVILSYDTDPPGGIIVAVTATVYNKFKKNQNDGTAVIDFDTDTLKLALLTSSYTPDLDAHDFFNDVSGAEVVGTGYVSGGATLASVAVTLDTANDRFDIDAADVSWASSTITARYGVLYKSTGTASTSPLVFLLDFGADQSTSNTTFTVQWNASGFLRFA